MKLQQAGIGHRPVLLIQTEAWTGMVTHASVKWHVCVILNEHLEDVS